MPHHRQHVLQASWAQVLMMLTGTGRRPSATPYPAAHRHGQAWRIDRGSAGSMPSLCGRTCPRPPPSRTCCASPGMRITTLLEHEHLALTEIHRLTGHAQLFDTIFVYSYPIDTADCLSPHGRSSAVHRHGTTTLSVAAIPESAWDCVSNRHRCVRFGDCRVVGRPFGAGVGR